ncbi:MAG: universal stress protein [Gammaproteobacteria bacterium]
MAETQKIVIPTDFSKSSLAALEWVKKLSDRGHAEVHCINVVQEPAMYMPVSVGVATPAVPNISELERISTESLNVFVNEHLFDLDPKPIQQVLVGRPAEEITEYAKQIDAQMIVIATRGQSGLAHMLLGSTAEGVVRQAECPVLTVRG